MSSRRAPPSARGTNDRPQRPPFPTRRTHRGLEPSERPVHLVSFGDHTRRGNCRAPASAGTWRHGRGDQHRCRLPAVQRGAREFGRRQVPKHVARQSVEAPRPDPRAANHLPREPARRSCLSPGIKKRWADSMTPPTERLSPPTVQRGTSPAAPAVALAVQRALVTSQTPPAPIRPDERGPCDEPAALLGAAP